jgi:Na+/melibiose symporter-like transporter
MYGQASCFPTGDQMGALSIGKGISGLLMNFTQIVIMLVNSKDGQPDMFMSTFVFYIITAVMLFFISMLYFVERNNTFSQYYYTKLEKQNKQRISLPLNEELKEMVLSCSSAKECLLYIVQILLVTFIAFPGVLISMPFEIFAK